MPTISLPHDWDPREYQLDFLQAMDSGINRAALVWHRRSGKDSTSLNFTAKKAFERVGNYWHLMPTQKQARRALWNGVDGRGRKIIDQAFPKEIRDGKANSSEMMIPFKNGSTWQLCGSDNYDALVGANPVGLVFSEWSLCDPQSWNFLRPILLENGGWAIFIYTARGKNHGFRMSEMAKGDPNWFHSIKTVDDTRREDGSPVITPEMIEQERREGMEEHMVQQEYYCSFNAPIQGAYYADLMDKARQEGRITNVPYDPAVPVNTFWDLGMNDQTTIWFHQQVGQEHRFIDYYSNHGEGFSHYAKTLKELPYIYGTHFLPHDAEVRELTTGKHRKEVLEDLGIRPVDVVARIAHINEGIEMVRQKLPLCWFDDTKCAEGIDGLESYRREYDEKLETFKPRPLHDWASHPSDAFRQFAQGYHGPRSGFSALQNTGRRGRKQNLGRDNRMRV